MLLKKHSQFLEKCDFSRKKLSRISILLSYLADTFAKKGKIRENRESIYPRNCLPLKYLDHHLNPLVSFTRSYVKDTNHCLARLGKLGSIPDVAYLCTVDVVGLYPSIPHGEGLEAMREALGRRVNPTVPTDTLAGLASLVLKHNYFEFNNKIYRQKLGMAIGMKFAPAYANLVMSGLEERLLEASADKPLVWMRFIDDVFFIWTHGEEKLKLFINFLNSSHDNIKCTSEYSRETISCLDV